MSWPANPDISDLLLFAARRIPGNTRPPDMMASAFSMATSMLEGCLETEPEIAMLAVLLYRKRFAELQQDFDRDIEEKAECARLETRLGEIDNAEGADIHE